MTDVLQKVQDAIEEHDLLKPGDRIVVGLSGGPDSLCLLDVLRRLSRTHDLTLHVAHLNHAARGAASDADAEFVRMVAAQWELPVTIERHDVPALADEHGLAFEEAARRVRYTFLADVAARFGGASIAVGHNADDQAETVLMHVIRGSGLAGLRGMLPRTPVTDYRLLVPLAQQEGSDQNRQGQSGSRADAGKTRETACVIRPLLNVTRGEIEGYCSRNHLHPRFDRSNLDTTYFRNRLRHELLPELETYNPRIRKRLRHMAAVVAADYDLLVDARQEAWKRVVREEREDTVIFDQGNWQALPVSLQRATLRHATYRLRRSLRDVTFVHVENARRVALEGETGQAATLPMGLEMTVGYETLNVGEAGSPGPPPDEPLLWTGDPLPVSVPGTTPLPASDWVLEAEPLQEWRMTRITNRDHPWTAYFDAETLEDPVVLRQRLPDDRFQPLGMGGHHVKVSDLMINLKIPEPWRSHVPLLVAAGEILWVCGRRIAETAKIGTETEAVVRFRFQQTTQGQAQASGASEDAAHHS